MNRLLIVVPLHQDQFEPAKKFLMDGEGLCTCGRVLTAQSSKFLLGQINSSYSIDPKARNTMVIAAYCFGCCQAINDTMRRLKVKGPMDLKPPAPKPEKRLFGFWKR